MLDAIIISDSGADTYSASSPMRLQLDGEMALIQTVRNYLEHDGHVRHPVVGDDVHSWRAAPKLNGIQLHSHLQREGFETAVIDDFARERDRFEALLNEGPRAVIISTTFIIEKAGLRRLVAEVRTLAPDIFIIAGGPFVYASYLLLQRAAGGGYDVASPRDDYLFLSPDGRPDVDLYVADKDGLDLLATALRRLGEGRSLADLPNTIRWEGAAYAVAERQELPPADSRIHWRGVPAGLIAAGAVNVQASVGCPYRCEFCNFVKDTRFTFVKPLDDLVAELSELATLGVRYVRFVDDNFRLGRPDLDDVCRRFIREGLPLKWMSFVRASTLERSDLDLLRRAGCIEVQIGIESADPTILQNMKKRAEVMTYQRVITALLERGINCSCCFVAGFPGETEASFQRTVDFIEGISCDDQEGVFTWSIYPFLLFPLSPIYEEKLRAKYGLHGYLREWQHATMDSRTARDLITQAFNRIESAGPIYSGDNLDLLAALSPAERNRFMRARHRLSKRFLGAAVDRELVIATFAEISLA